MLNVTRILFIVDIALLALNTVLSAVSTGNFFPKEAGISFAESAAVLLYFNLGVLFYLSGMGRAIGKGTAFGKKYTLILPKQYGFCLDLGNGKKLTCCGDEPYDACELAEKLHVRNLLLYHTEDKNLDERKKLYLEEGSCYYHGNLFVPDDLESIEP